MIVFDEVEGMDRKRPWPVSSHSSGIHLQELKKTKKTAAAPSIWKNEAFSIIKPKRTYSLVTRSTFKDT
jgi:hypothetical protein